MTALGSYIDGSTPKWEMAKWRKWTRRWRLSLGKGTLITHLVKSCKRCFVDVITHLNEFPLVLLFFCIFCSLTQIYHILFSQVEILQHEEDNRGVQMYHHQWFTETFKVVIPAGHTLKNFFFSKVYVPSLAVLECETKRGWGFSEINMEIK